MSAACNLKQLIQLGGLSRHSDQLAVRASGVTILNSFMRRQSASKCRYVWLFLCH
jgi:hypothetical protein